MGRRPETQRAQGTSCRIRPGKMHFLASLPGGCSFFLAYMDERYLDTHFHLLFPYLGTKAPRARQGALTFHPVPVVVPLEDRSSLRTAAGTDSRPTPGRALPLEYGSLCAGAPSGSVSLFHGFPMRTGSRGLRVFAPPAVGASGPAQ